MTSFTQSSGGLSLKYVWSVILVSGFALWEKSAAVVFGTGTRFGTWIGTWVGYWFANWLVSGPGWLRCGIGSSVGPGPRARESIDMASLLLVVVRLGTKLAKNRDFFVTWKSQFCYFGAGILAEGSLSVLDFSWPISVREFKWPNLLPVLVLWMFLPLTDIGLHFWMWSQWCWVLSAECSIKWERAFCERGVGKSPLWSQLSACLFQNRMHNNQTSLKNAQVVASRCIPLLRCDTAYSIKTDSL